ncbi:hypothetical protein Tco_1225358 [Tanacetum coccineum]
MNCLSGVVVDTSDELVSSITQVVNQFLNGKCPKILGEYFASAPLTMLVKLGGGIRLIVVGTVWRCLVSKVSVVVIGHSSDGYLNDLQYGVGVSGRGEAILHHIVTASGPGFGKMGVEAYHLTLRIRGAWHLLIPYNTSLRIIQHESKKKREEEMKVLERETRERVEREYRKGNEKDILKWTLAYLFQRGKVNELPVRLNILRLTISPEACSFMLCDLDFEPLSLSLSSLPSCDLVSLTNILILCLILKASNQS